MTEKAAEEIRNFLRLKDQEDTERVRIVFDGKQYNIRIPKRMVNKMKINPEKDVFEFYVSPDEENPLKLKMGGELKQGEES